MDKALWVFLGGGIGSVLRYSVGLLVASQTPQSSDTPHWLGMYPIATLLVNIIGCGLIGIAWGTLGMSDSDNNTLRLALIVGVLGGFTTFSSFGWETLELLQNQRVGTAIAYVLASVLLGLLAAWAGYSVSHGGS